MTADLVEATAVGAGEPRREACRLFAEELRRALAELPSEPGREVPGITVTALGVRDAFAAPGCAEDASRSTLPVHLYSRQVMVGPWPTKGRAGCADCLRRRWQGVRSVGLREGLELRGGTREAGPWPYRVPFAAQAVAALIARLGAASTGRAPRDDRRPFPDVWLVDLENLTVRHHPLVPEPDCPGCGTPEPVTADSAALVLRSAPKYRPGVSRVRPVDAYGLQVDAFANPHWGAVGPSVVCDVTSPTTSATVGCFSSRSGDYLRETFWGGHADTYHASTRIGLLEGLERFAGMRARGRALTLTASLDELGPDAVDPRETGLYTDDFHRANPWVPPFTPDRPIPWEWGWSLRDARPVLVPSRLVYYSIPTAGDNFVFECSNGCAIGGCLEEAVLGGLLELVERDSFLNGWYGAARLPRIDLGTVGSPTAAAMAERAALQGYDVHVFDNRIDLAIPAVTVVGVRRDGGPGTLSFAAAASLDPRSAVEGALSEVLSYIPHLARQTAERRGELDAMADDFFLVRHLKDHPQLYGLPRMAECARGYLEPSEARPFDEVYRDWERHGRPRAGDLRDDVAVVRDELVRAGHDVVVVDQTSPEQERMGLRTVSTVVPGLLPIDFGWNRQRALLMPRLRTALRRGGHRDRDLTDAEIRRAPHPFP
ncbi:cyclodehydratase [Streptomyces sp. NTH33]|uniref:TOMM precursor leader peptide-binding protein n=1 Tax=Streptomyces sp. NTH33 TaxID=1735453 RepID=UPI000DA7EF38|nr:TOMM precursor leader peptide-binding protein [Streptomyces sp. NTH33]PZG91133.1 cyclodehydratase [Streptomyces sp. NTH33]